MKQMKYFLRKAMDDELAFSWLTTGLVCLRWADYFAARGWFGRGRNSL
jgi:hypothetical protein